MTPSDASNSAPSSVIAVVVHDSFALPEDVVADFERTSGINIEFIPLGDAGTLATQISLTAGAPLGDVVYGIDNTFASRVITSGALEPYVVPGATDTLAGSLTAIDYSDVCFNIDLAAFDHLAIPESAADLTDPAYSGKISLPNPATSSPGLAFLLATYAEYGDGWADYWRALRSNDVHITASWSDSYFVDFSAPNYGGKYPIVLSYASSPPSEVIDGEPTTAALLDTCFRQVEYAGVLAGTSHRADAQEVVAWMFSEDVQAALPESMYVYPVMPSTALPPQWHEFAPLSEDPITLSPDTIDAERERLLREWTAIMLDGQ